MAKQTSLFLTQTLKNPAASLANADGTTAKTLYTVATNDAVMKSLCITSTDSAARNVQVVLNDGSTSRVLGTVPVPALSGTDGTQPAVDAFSSSWLPGLPIDQNGKRYLPLASGQVVKVGAVVAVTAAKTIDCIAAVEEY